MVLKIAIIGPECSGKTSLCIQLSEIYQEPMVPEFARNFLSNLSKPYVEQDLLAIAQGQLASEEQRMKLAKRFLFCDTDLSNIQLWSEVKFNRCSNELLQVVAKQNYAAYILLQPSELWIADPLREMPSKKDRDKLYQAYLDMALSYGTPLLRYNNNLETLHHFLQSLH